MGIFEIKGGPITHNYLMGKSKSELAYEILDYIRAIEEYRKEIASLTALQQPNAVDAESCSLCGPGTEIRKMCLKCHSLIGATD